MQFKACWQKFRESNEVLKELYCKSIWRKIFAVGENFRNFHNVAHYAVRENEKFYLT